MTGLIGPLALLAAGLFAGAALYVSVAEHPARMRLDDEALLAQWKPSYARGKAMQASLALIGSLLALWGWWESREWLWLAGGLCLLANWPFSLIVILPVNYRLEAIPPGGAGPESRALLVRWGRLHAVRALLGSLAASLMLVALALSSGPNRAMDDCCLPRATAIQNITPGQYEVTVTPLSAVTPGESPEASAQIRSTIGRPQVSLQCHYGRPAAVGRTATEGCVFTRVGDRGGVVDRVAQCTSPAPGLSAQMTMSGTRSSDRYDYRIRLTSADGAGRIVTDIVIREEGHRLGPCPDVTPARPVNSFF